MLCLFTVHSEKIRRKMAIPSKNMSDPCKTEKNKTCVHCCP